MDKISFNDFKLLFLAKELAIEREVFERGDNDMEQHIEIVKMVSEDINACENIGDLVDYLEARGFEFAEAYEILLENFIQK